MADFHIFGVPHGFNASQCDMETLEFLSDLYIPNHGTMLKTYRRPNDEMYYTFLMYENPGGAFMDADGRAGSFFGMALVLKNQQVKDTSKLYKLFMATYDNYVKNKLVQEFPNGNKRWMKRIISNQNAQYIANGFSALSKSPEFKLELQPIQSLQNPGMMNTRK